MTEQPIPDTRTCREKQDAAIAALQNIAELTAALTHNLKLCVDNLNARVAQQESDNTLYRDVVEDMIKRLNGYHEVNAALTHSLTIGIDDLRARVATLEARFTGMYYTPANVIEPAAGTGALLAESLDPTTITWYGDPPCAAPVARTATPNQTYSWQPGGWVDEYVAAVDGTDEG